MGSGLHHLVQLLVAALAFNCLVAWVVTAININETKSFWSSYSRIDPSFLTLCILGWLWFSAVLLFGGINTFIFRAMPVIIVTALFGCWFLADAIAYASRRYNSTTRCQAGFVNFIGCRRFYKYLLGISWVHFAVILILLGLLFMLASRHSRTYNTSVSGFQTPVHHLGNDREAGGRDGIDAYRADVKAPPAREVTHTTTPVQQPAHGDTQTV